MKVERWCPALLIMGLMWGMGCGQEVAPFEEATVAVDWSVMPLGCAVAEVESVQVRLENRRNTYETTASCERGSTVLEAVVPGRYDVTIRGRTQQGQATFGASLEGFAVRPGVDVRTGVVELEALAGSAHVDWNFGVSHDCITAGAEQVEIIAYDKGHHEAGRVVRGCGDATVKMEELRAGEYLFYGRTVGDGPRYEGVAQTEIGRGQTVTVSLELIVVGLE